MATPLKSAIRELPSILSDIAPDALPEILTDVPGPGSRSLAERLRRVESPDTTCFSDEFPVFWQRALGCHVWDVDGNRYLDLIAGFGAAALGHAHPAVVEATQRQTARLIHGMGDVHPTEIRLELSERLAALAPGGGEWKSIYGLNGADAVEAALKTAALASERPGIIAFHGGYHGLSIGALALTSSPHFREGVEHFLPHNTTFFPYPGFLDETAEEGRLLLKEIQEFIDSDNGGEIGAVIIEPIAGRGGVVIPPPNFLSGLRKLCDRNKLVLIFDEIFTGLGRTGKWFASDHDAVVPDLLLLGKALGGGFPLSVCLGQADVIDAWPESTGEARHTSTFMGHPVGCAAALAVLREIETGNWIASVAEMGRNFLRDCESSLQSIPCVGAIRGRGLMLGVEILNPDTGEPDPAAAWSVVLAALRRGLILLVSGPSANILQFTPPFTIAPAQLDFAIDTLADLLRNSGGAGTGR